MADLIDSMTAIYSSVVELSGGDQLESVEGKLTRQDCIRRGIRTAQQRSAGVGATVGGVRTPRSNSHNVSGMVRIIPRIVWTSIPHGLQWKIEFSGIYALLFFSAVAISKSAALTGYCAVTREVTDRSEIALKVKGFIVRSEIEGNWLI